MRPVRADSRIPKGEMSLRKESILSGLADLFIVEQLVSVDAVTDPRSRLHRGYIGVTEV